MICEQATLQFLLDQLSPLGAHMEPLSAKVSPKVAANKEAAENMCMYDLDKPLRTCCSLE